MPTPTTSDLHIDAALTNVSVKYQNADLVGEKICPPLTVKKDSDKYFVYGKQDLRLFNDLKAPGARAKQVEWSIDSTPTYSLEEHSLEMQLIDEVRDNTDDPIRYDADSTEYVSNMILLRVEKMIGDFLNDYTVNYEAGHSSAVATKWDVAAGDPLTDIDDAREVVRSKIGRYPNTMVVSPKVHKLLRKHSKLLEMYKYTKAGTLTADILKEIFEMKNYYVYGAGYISSAEGQAEVLADIWADNVALIYVPDNPGLKQLSFSYLFRKTGYRLVERWREAALRSDWIRVSDKYNLKSISTVAGYHLRDVLS